MDETYLFILEPCLEWYDATTALNRIRSSRRRSINSSLNSSRMSSIIDQNNVSDLVCYIRASLSRFELSCANYCARNALFVVAYSDSWSEPVDRRLLQPRQRQWACVSPTARAPDRPPAFMTVLRWLLLQTAPTFSTSHSHTMVPQPPAHLQLTAKAASVGFL
jgi:hypothetical protein